MKTFQSIVLVAALMIGMLSVVIVPTVAATSPVSTDALSASGSLATTTIAKATTTQATIPGKSVYYTKSGSLLPGSANMFTLQTGGNKGTESVSVYAGDTGYVFKDNDGGWPSAWYEAPEKDWLIADTNDPNCYLNWQFEVFSGATTIVVYFAGQSPEDMVPEGYAEILNYYIDPEYGSYTSYNWKDLGVGKYSGSISVKDLGVAEELIDENGCFYISAMKIFAVGGETRIYNLTVGEKGYVEDSIQLTTTPTMSAYPDIPLPEGSLFPSNAADFTCVTGGYENTVHVANATDEGYAFINTNYGWPQAWYMGDRSEWVVADVNDPNCYLNWDFEVVSGATNIIVFFAGQSPTDQTTAGTAETINYYIDPTNNTLSSNAVYDIGPGRYTGSIHVSQTGIGETFIDKNGKYYISGIKVFAVGTDGRAEVIVRDLSVRNKMYTNTASTTRWQKDAMTVYADSLNKAQITDESGAWYAFTPEKSGDYIFTAKNKTSGAMLIAELYNFGGNYVARADAYAYDEAEESNVAWINAPLAAGNIYFYRLYTYDNVVDCEFQVGLTATMTTAPVYLEELDRSVPVLTTTSPISTTATKANNGFLYTVSGNQATITGYTEERTHITVPDKLGGYPVTAIGKYAFAEQSMLRSVALPSTLTYIGEFAFANCTNLEAITIPDNVTTIEESAFIVCSSLRTVELPSKLTTISANLFQYCVSLEYVRIPDGVTSIEHHAFWECYSLMALVIPGTVTTVDNTLFYGTKPHILFTGTKAQFKAIADSLGVTDGQYHYGVAGDEVQLAARHDHCTQWGYSEYACSLCDVTLTTWETLMPQGHVIDENGGCRYCHVKAEVCLTSRSPYDANASQRYMVRYPEAGSVSVTFTAKTMLEDGYDFVSIYDANGVLQGNYTGNELAGRTITLSGDTVELRLVSDSTECEAGFAAECITTSNATDEPAVEPGDLNGDGIVNMMDAFVTYKCVADGTLTDAQKEAVDMNGDGLVNMIDAFILYKTVAGQ